MKSIRTKIVNVLFASVTFTVAAILIVSVICLGILAEQDSGMLLKHIGDENVNKINSSMSSVKSSVDSIFYYASDQVGHSVSSLQREQYRKNYLDQMESMCLAEVRNNSSASVVYFRMNTDYSDPCGFIYSRDPQTGEFHKGTLTEIELYDKDDTDRVGWYYLPQTTREPVWIGPYMNLNLNIKMMSYVAPLYLGGSFVGIMGIDIDLSEMSEMFNDVKLYDNSSIMLMSGDGSLIYSKDNQTGLSAEDFSERYPHTFEAIEASLEKGEAVKYGNILDQYKLYASRLENDMFVCVQVPVNEINSSQRTVLAVSVIISILILLVTMSVTMLVINGFLSPLKELTNAAQQLASGKMDVKLQYSEDDEIGSLSKTFSMMSASLKHYFDHFHSLAYTDSLTGLNNKAAFDITKGVIESELALGRASFAIIIMDVNNLKIVNDTKGHEVGDELLVHVTSCLRETFVGYPLYRIGGDEFCSIINNADPKQLIEKLHEVTSRRSKRDLDLFGTRYQIAAGGAIYDKRIDESFQDVFKRADDLMYVNKKALKEQDNV